MVNENAKVIRVGSRKSELALIQTKYVIATLQDLYPEDKFEIHTMTTMGDRVLNISLPKIGEKALFTKDLEDALHNGNVDFVVHSLKDLPTCLPDGMAIGAILKREDPRDALVLSKKFAGKTLSTLPDKSIIGTSSLRRSAQLARCYPNLIVQDIRGNLNTRLAKLDAENSKFSGIILAQAGLNRMGWQHRISQTIEPTDILYAVGQGALAVECRAGDVRILAMLQKLSCLETVCKILTERSFLKTLGGGCSAPVAVRTQLKRHLEEVNKFELNMTGAVWSLNGQKHIQEDINCSLQLYDDNENEIAVVPHKRMKLIDPPPKPNSPPIVDDSKVASTSQLDASKFDIESLINIHGEVFKKCPYSMTHKRNRTSVDAVDNVAANTAPASSEIEKCPLHIPVGQDVMGECPYVDTDHKVLIDDNAIDLKHVMASNSTDQGPSVSGCPFLSATKSTKTDDEPSKSEDVQKCPFLAKAVTTTTTTALAKDEINEKDTLYCGLYRHNCYNLDIFVKCESLGQRLAKKLIENGALEVMAAAQTEIRKNI